MFTKEERSSFSYWFAHLCAFNMTAMQLRAWKFKYLFHDWHKPWLRLFMPYEKLQKFHRTHSNHHIEYLNKFADPYSLYAAMKIDWHAMIIDWECSRFTKEDSPMTAYDYWMLNIDPLQYNEKYYWIWVMSRDALIDLGLKKDSK